MPELYTISADSINCRLNGYGDFTTPSNIPLGVVVPTDSDYTFSLSQLYNIPTTTLIRLEIEPPARLLFLQGSNYTAHIDSTEPATGRFFLHISLPVVADSSSCRLPEQPGRYLACSLMALLHGTVLFYLTAPATRLIHFRM